MSTKQFSCTHLIKVVFIDAAYEAVWLHILFDGLQLVTEFTERVDDQTYGHRECYTITPTK